jgi:hypothetical protein
MADGLRDPLLQALYLLLVTNKASNILEDLETLRLLAKVVPEYVPSLDEDGVSQAAFELLFAFDEVRERMYSVRFSMKGRMHIASRHKNSCVMW